MSEEKKAVDAKEGEVFDQELSKEDLDAVAGGDFWDDNDSNKDYCKDQYYRTLYGGNGFPNCAATVEDLSACGTNDACRQFAVVYKDMEECYRAWR